LDASVTLAWCFKDEVTPYTTAVLRMLADTEATEPTIWPLEIANVLALSERRHRLTPADTALFIEMLQGLPVRFDPNPPGLHMWPILALCRRHGLTAYDASYLELAGRARLPLATLDARLRAAAREAGVRLVE
jgi:predicted nucleic acid-binding protein